MSIHHVPRFVVLHDNIVFQVRWQPQVVDAIFYAVEDRRNIVVTIQDKDLHVRIVAQGLRHIWPGIDRRISIPTNVSFVRPIPLKTFTSAGSDCILQVFTNPQLPMKVI